jgi:PTS system mannose-specific IID component
MEEEGRDPEEIRRFKVAVRGPLGSLGDALVWVGWRPGTVLAALVLALLGAPPWMTVAFFLATYNLGHLALRTWGFRVGLERGSQVGDALRTVGFSRHARRLAGAGVFFLGTLVGLALAWSWRGEAGPLAVLATTGGVWGLWLGSLAGQRSWRWVYWAVAVAVGIFFFAGWIG